MMGERDYTPEEIEFAVFCIENVAIHFQVDAKIVFDALTKESDILYDYIIPCFDILHTQGKEYIVNDIADCMEENGVRL